MADPLAPQDIAPSGQKSDVTTVQKITDSFLTLETRFTEFRREMEKNYRYVCNDQLDRDVRKILEEEHRPAMIFNIMQPVILYLAGVLSQNRQAMKADPMRFGDELLAEMHQVLVSDYAMQGCDGYEEIVKASIDAIIGKVGWLNNYWSTRDNPEGQWITESADPFTMMWDPDGRKTDQTDWRYQCASSMYSAEEILIIHAQDMDPDTVQKVRAEADRLEGMYRQLGKPIGWLDRVAFSIGEVWETTRGGHGNPARAGLLSTFFDGRTGLYRVVEWHERRSVIRRFAYSAATREKEEIPAAQAENPEFVQATLAKFPGSKIEVVPQEQMWVAVAAPTLLPDVLILEKPYRIQGKGFQHKPIFCYPFHPNLLETPSVVDALISPQDSFNQRRMTMLEYIMDTVNPPVDAPKFSIDPDDLPAWQSKERGLIRFYKPGWGGAMPKRNPPQIDKQALQVFSEEDRDLVQKISGVSPNSQGYKESANEPAALFNARVEQGMVMMSFFNTQVMRAMKNVFRYTDAGLQKNMTFPRMVRLLSEPPEGMPGVQKMSQGDQDTYWLRLNWPTLQGVINDVRQGEFDWRADLTQLNSTTRKMKLAEIMEFIRYMPKELIPWGSLMKLWDSPVSAEFQAYAKQKQGEGDQAQAQQLVARIQAQRLQQTAGENKLLTAAGAAAQPVPAAPVEQPGV